MDKEQIWNFWAKYYERLWVQQVSLGPTRSTIINYLKNYFKKDTSYKVVDVGCGTGQLLQELEQNLREIDLELLGIDFSKEMLEEARKRNMAITFLQMKAEELGQLEERFDLVICTHSFPYYENQPQVLRNFRSMLGEGGRLLLAQASQNSLYDHFVMTFVKLTTGRAKYPSVKAILEMSEGLFQCEEVIRIKERWYMPSIYLFILKGNKNEGTFN